MSHKPEQQSSTNVLGFAEINARRRARQIRAENQEALRRESVSVEFAAFITGTSKRHLYRLIKQGMAISFMNNKNILLPTWQLQEDAFSPIIGGSAEVAKAYNSDLASLHAWMNEEKMQLYGSTPAEMLREGHVGYIISLAALSSPANR